MSTKDETEPTRRKRFSVTIMGEADYFDNIAGAKLDFEAFFREYMKTIEDEMNNQPGIRVKSAMTNFKLYPEVGRVQESES